VKNPENTSNDADPEFLQRPVIGFLSEICAYEPTRNFSLYIRTSNKDIVSRISTHSAHLFLIGELVIKIKRAVRYSYLDMTSLSSRHNLCCRELELNKPVLPQIYQSVIPITRETDGTLQFNGSGTIVEWALCMRRFDEKAVLDNIAQENRLSVDLSKKMGLSIAKYHQSLESADVRDGHVRIREVIEELVEELALYRAVFSEGRLDEFQRRGLKELDSCKSLLNERAQQGYVKRCHGDLHLRNLVLIHDVPVPFDALEFDERMATTDVLYDLAFVLMDLDHRALFAQSNGVLNEYLLHSDEQSIIGLRLLRLFLSCRAGIRAMTTAQAASLETEASKSLQNEARSYFALALKYLDRQKSVLVAIGGFSGSGKSTVAMSIADVLGRPRGALLFRSDTERKVALGIAETATLPEQHYTEKASLENYQRLIKKSELALDAGQSVIVDAVFKDNDCREAVEEIALKRNVPFFGFWLDAPVEVLENRIKQRKNDASDATIDVLKKQLSADLGCINWYIVDAGDTLENVLAQVCSILNHECD